MEIHIRNYLKATGKGQNDQFICENCGKAYRVSFHHLIFRSHGGGGEFENIMCLCGKCHDKAHFKLRPYLTYEFLKAKHMDLVNLIKEI